MDDLPSTKHLIYIILPLLIILVIIILSLTFHIRQRRAASASYPGMRNPETNGIIALRNQRNGLGAVNSTEGLNELGEAPPPYDRKKELTGGNSCDGYGDGDGATAADAGGIRPRDLEEGHATPPEYIREPPPVLARETR